jgi:hypothetical protein
VRGHDLNYLGWAGGARRHAPAHAAAPDRGPRAGALGAVTRILAALVAGGARGSPSRWTHRSHDLVAHRVRAIPSRGCSPAASPATASTRPPTAGYLTVSATRAEVLARPLRGRRATGADPAPVGAAAAGARAPDRVAPARGLARDSSTARTSAPARSRRSRRRRASSGRQFGSPAAPRLGEHTVAWRAELR